MTALLPLLLTLSMSQQLDLSSLGKVIEVDGGGTFRAHVQYRDAAGKKTHITGPLQGPRSYLLLTKPIRLWSKVP